MRLRDLNARFIGGYHDKDSQHEHTGYQVLPSIDGAQGVMFQCPKCAVGLERGEENGRRFVRGAHSVICWFRNPRGAPPVPGHADPKPGRWWMEGTSIDDLTFTHGTPAMAKSVQLLGGCNWHGFVNNGDAS
jgi:hypothetical protein